MRLLINDRTNRLRFNKRGASEVLGTILLVGITVTMLSTTFVWMLGFFPEPTNTNLPDLAIGYSNNNITLVHVGGGNLERGELAVVVLEDYQLMQRYGLEDGGADVSDGVLSINEKWNHEYAPVGSGELIIQALHVVHNAVIAETVVSHQEEMEDILDLEILDSDIELSNPTPIKGENVQVNVTVHNLGAFNATNVTVRLFRDDKFLQKILVPVINMNNTTIVEFNWIPILKGVHVLNVKVTPLENETVFYNNYAKAFVTVETNVIVTYVDPNPYINSQDISFSDNYPLNGDSITIYATISNSGSAGATTTVYFYDGAREPGNLIGTKDIMISGGGQTSTSIPWTINSGGEHTLRVFLDNILPLDANGGDNEAVKALAVAPTILVVNDDNHPEDGTILDSLSRITDTIEACGFEYQNVYIGKGDNGPSYGTGLKQLKDFDLVIWSCGFETENTLTTADRTNLQTYLDNGGYLWLMGYGIVNDLGAGNPFLSNYLRVQAVLDQDRAMEGINGTIGNPITYDHNFTYLDLGLDYHKIDYILPEDMGLFYSPGNGMNHSTMFENPVSNSKIAFMTWDLTTVNGSRQRTKLAFLLLNWFGGVLEGGAMDLALSDLILSSHSPRYMDIVNITAYVRNNGQSLMENVTVAFYLGDDLIGSFPDGLTNPAKVTVPPNGGEAVISKQFLATKIGRHHVEVKVDPFNEIHEISETNNDLRYSQLVNSEIGIQYNILILDDDGSPNNGGVNSNVTENVSKSLEKIGYDFDIRVVPSPGDGPNVSLLKKYNSVIWLTGQDSVNTLTVSDQENISHYLEGNYEESQYIEDLHVHLLVIGQDILNDLLGPGTDRITPADSFARNYLKVHKYSTDLGLPSVLEGRVEDPITHGLEYPTNPTGLDRGDFIWPVAGGQQMFSKNPLGIRYSEEKYETIFLPWEYSFIKDTRESSRSSSNLVTRALNSEKSYPDISRGQNTRAPVEVFSDDMEAGINGWKKTGLWHMTDIRARSGSNSWYFGKEESFNYDTGSTSKGTLTSPEISLVGKANCTLSFDHWLETEDNPPFDTGFVEISKGDGKWESLTKYSNAPSSWLQELDMNISFYDSEPVVYIRFRFDTIDSQNNDFEGWFIDDVVIKGDVINSIPTLSSPSVSPSVGLASTNYTYSVVYTDADNETPTNARVYIDGIGYEMSNTDTIYPDGSQFKYSTDLDIGVHSYYFTFSDGTYIVKAPEVGEYQGPIVTSSTTSGKVAFYKAEFLYLIMGEFDYIEERVELKTSGIDISTSNPNPVLGNSYVLKTDVYNKGGKDSNAFVRVKDATSIIDSISLFVPSGGHSTAEIIWTPLFAGNRIITVEVDPDNEIEEVFDFNNLAISTDNYVYFFYDDMEGEFSNNWDHDSTVLNINGESTLNYMEQSETNIISDWDYSESSGSWIRNSSIYHSLNTSFFIYEPVGDIAHVPVDVGMTIDHSGSMNNGMQGQTRRYWAKEGAKGFVNNFYSEDEGSIWMFDGDLDHLQPFTSNKNLLISAIDSIPPGSGTALWDATIALVNDVVTNSDEGDFAAAIVLTDGWDSASASSKDDAVVASTASGIPVFMVGFADNEGQVNSVGMTEVAEASAGGFYRFASSPAILDEVYSEIAQTIEAMASSGVTRAPPALSYDSPSDNELNVDPQGALLTWSCTDPEGDAITYDVYFGQDPAPGMDELRSDDQTERSFSPGLLAPYRTYYWKIIAEDDNGETTEGPVWQFTTGKSGEYGGGNQTVTDTISKYVSTNNDDAEETVSTGDMYRSSSDLELIRDGGDQLVGIRFQSLNIPPGATIDQAQIEFTCDETTSGGTSLIFHCEDTDNAAIFSSNDDDISDRTMTTSSVDWNAIPAWNIVHEKHLSPDLSPIVQEVIGRPGWDSGNSLVFIITGNGERVAESYEGADDHGDMTLAPKLVVQFSYTVGSESGPFEFLDDFDDGDIDGWTESGNGGVDASTNDHHSGTHCAWFNDGGSGTDERDILRRNIDLEGVGNAELTFWLRSDSDMENGGDRFYLQIDDGSGWEQVDSYDVDDFSSWTLVTVDLSGYDMVSDFGLSFEGYKTSSDENWRLDDVKITGLLIPDGGAGSGGGHTIWYPPSPMPALGWNNLTTQEFSISGSNTAELSFYHKYNLQTGINGGFIMIGVKNGATFDYHYVIPKQKYSSNLYLGEDGSGSELPEDDLGNQIKYAYNGVSGNGLFTWSKVEMDLISQGDQLGVDFTSAPIKVKFVYYYFGGGTDGGWWIDDINIKVSSQEVSADSPDVWQLVEGSAHSGKKFWWNGNVSNPVYFKEGIDNSLYTRQIDLTSARQAELKAMFRFNINPEAGLPPDGFRVEISSDGGTIWTAINKGARSSSGLSGSDTSSDRTETGVSPRGNNWVPANSLSRLEVSLNPWIGEVVIIRFRVVTTSAVDYEHNDPDAFVSWGGLSIDDVCILGQSYQEDVDY